MVGATWEPDMVPAQEACPSTSAGGTSAPCRSTPYSLCRRKAAVPPVQRAPLLQLWTDARAITTPSGFDRFTRRHKLHSGDLDGRLKAGGIPWTRHACSHAHLRRVQLEEDLCGEAAALELHAHSPRILLRLWRDPHASARHQLPAVHRLRLRCAISVASACDDTVLCCTA